MINNKKVKSKNKSTNNNFYENPLDFGVFYRFEEAVRILSTESGSLNKRLYRAYYHGGIFHLIHENFNDEFIRENLHNIEKIANIGLQCITKIKLPPDCHINPIQFYLHWRQASKMANYIFQIYRYIMQLRMSKEQNND